MFGVSDYDRQEWQRQQAARDAELDKQREREAKARERSARNARRKLERLHRTLKESGDLTEFEDEFGESVAERLDKFGAAFANPELGRPGDALSASQKRVVAAMNRKVKDAKARRLKGPDTAASGDTSERPRRYSSFRNKGSGFGKSKGYTPRVRQLDETFEAEEAPISRQALEAVQPPPPAPGPTSETRSDIKPGTKPQPISDHPPNHPSERPPVGKPFLRIVK